MFDKGVLIPKFDNIPFAYFSFTNLLFLFPQIEHCDFICNLTVLVLIIFELTLSECFLHTLVFMFCFIILKWQIKKMSGVKLSDTQSIIQPLISFFIKTQIIKFLQQL